MRQEEREEMARLYDDSPDIIGAWGELITAQAIRNELKIRVIKTLYIGGSQIDMVAISPYGVFVIENKNYHGVVLGYTKAQYWRVYYTQDKWHKLYNPVMQNQKHREAVVSMLQLMGYSHIKVYCPVIFNDFAVLRVRDGDRIVYNLTDFIERYKAYYQWPVLGRSVLSDLEDLFLKFQDISAEAKEAHVASKKFINLRDLG